jgi:hypothetical protein
MSDAAAHTSWTLARSRTPIDEVSANAAKKRNLAKRTKHWQYKGSFRVR